MSKRKRPAAWIRSDHADEYLVAAAHYLARAATHPKVTILPPPSVSATLYCAFAAEAYVNVALILLMGDEEYEPIARMPVRTKYYLAPWLGGQYQHWFTDGEPTLNSLDELFKMRNRLVHAQPERLYWVPSKDEGEVPPDVTAPDPDLQDVARWLAATADAVCRLSGGYPELSEMERIARPLREMEPLLMRFDPDRDGPELERTVRKMRENRIRKDEEDFMDDEEIENLIREQQPDWDIEGLEDG